MDALDTDWGGRTAEQWLNAVGCFNRMAERFRHQATFRARFASLPGNARTRAADRPVAHSCIEDYDRSGIRPTLMKALSESDLDYFRKRAAVEQAGAEGAHDIRVRQVHLEMAERYRALMRAGEASQQAQLHLVS